MKKLLSTLLLCLTILCVACSTEPEPDPFSVNLALYEPILSAYHQALAARQNDPSLQSPGSYNDHDLVYSVVYPYWSWEDTSALLEKIAFTFLDLDGDGTDELLLGWHDADSYDMRNGYVFAVYRLADDVPTFCFEGWERNRYQICSDHSVYLSGSGGASYTTYENSFLILLMRTVLKLQNYTILTWSTHPIQIPLQNCIGITPALRRNLPLFPIWKAARNCLSPKTQSATRCRHGNPLSSPSTPHLS